MLPDTWRNYAALVEHGAVGVNESTIGMLGEVCQLHFQFLRQPQVIRIQPSDEFSTSVAQAEIPCGGLSAILLVQISDTPRVGAQDLRGPVGGAVVGDNNFSRPDALDQNALHCLPDIPAAVVGRDDNADRLHGVHPLPEAAAASKRERTRNMRASSRAFSTSRLSKNPIRYSPNGNSKNMALLTAAATSSGPVTRVEARYNTADSTKGAAIRNKL